MTYSILYSSKSGNTKQLAGTIHSTLLGNKKEITGCFSINDSATTQEQLEIISNASCIFIGFWTDKGICEEALQKFLQTLEQKTIFLFGTAGFGGDDSYFDTILKRVSALCPTSNTIIGSFMCQGKMPPAVRNRYEQMKAQNPTDGKWDTMIANFDSASSHPDTDDLNRLKEQIVSIL